MNFDLSDDQIQLQDAVQRWAEKSYTFEHYRATVRSGGFDRANYAQLADLGLTGLLVSEDFGGLGMGAVEAMLVMQTLGGALVLEPLAHTFMASSVLAHFASPALQARWLPKIANGKTLAVLAYQERGNRYQLEKCEAKATPAHDSYTLTALKNIVPAGDQANAFIVPALLDGVLALFWIERGAASGITTRGYGTQNGSRAADVTFTYTPATLITRDGLAALELAIDIGLACACAQGVGLMDKTLALTADYSKLMRLLVQPCGNISNQCCEKKNLLLIGNGWVILL